MVMGFDEKTCEILKKSLTKHTRRGNGGTYSYYKGSDVIQRLNEAFNHGWTSERLEERIIEDQVLMLVAVTATTKDGEVFTHHGYGSASIARRNGAPLDIGNTYKSAYTSALKKAAEQFGIGLGSEEDSSRYATRTSPSRNTAPRTSATTPTPAAAPAAAKGRGQTMRRPEPMPPRGGSSNAAPRQTFSSAPAPAAQPAPVASAPAKQGYPTMSDLNGPVTDTQCRALTNLANMKKRGEKELVNSSGIQKDSFKDLTKEEAIQVIKYASTL